jgi:hypothetical protein
MADLKKVGEPAMILASCQNVLAETPRLLCVPRQTDLAGGAEEGRLRCCAYAGHVLICLRLDEAGRFVGNPN